MISKKPNLLDLLQLLPLIFIWGKIKFALALSDTEHQNKTFIISMECYPWNQQQTWGFLEVISKKSKVTCAGTRLTFDSKWRLSSKESCPSFRREYGWQPNVPVVSAENSGCWKVSGMAVSGELHSGCLHCSWNKLSSHQCKIALEFLWGIIPNNHSIKQKEFNLINVMTIKRQTNHGQPHFCTTSKLKKRHSILIVFSLVWFTASLDYFLEKLKSILQKLRWHSCSDSINIVLKLNKNKII